MSNADEVLGWHADDVPTYWDLAELLDNLTKEVGKSAWHNADPRPSERKRRAELLNKARFAVKVAREAR